MYKEINVYQFRDAFNICRPDNFSYDGLTVLYDYFEELENDLGDKVELDVVSLCCDFGEYDNLKELNEDYGNKYESLDELANETLVLPIPDSERFIIHLFWAYQAHLSGCVLLCLITGENEVSKILVKRVHNNLDLKGFTNLSGWAIENKGILFSCHATNEDAVLEAYRLQNIWKLPITIDCR